MKRFTVFAAAILFFACCNRVLPGESTYMKLVIDGSISIEGDPQVNPEVTIVFSFMLKPEGSFYLQMKQLEEQFRERGKKGDTTAAMAAKDWAERIDHASLRPDTNIEYLTDPTWTGQLKPLQKYDLRVQARIRNHMPTQIRGVVKAYCGTEAFPSSCTTANFFVSDTLFRSVEIAKPNPPKPDTLWKDGNPIIIERIHQPAKQFDTILPGKRIEGPVPPHRQPGKKSISSVPMDRGREAMKETAGSYLVSGRFFNVYIPHDTTPADRMRYYAGIFEGKRLRQDHLNPPAVSATAGT